MNNIKESTKNKIKINAKRNIQYFITLISLSFIALQITETHAQKHNKVQVLTSTSKTEASILIKKQWYQQLFQNTYLQHPDIPEGLLESLAFTSTRWKHRLPKKEQSYNGMPQVYGLFGFYHTSKFGFIDLVQKISDFNQISVEQFLNDEAEYIEYTARYIEHEINKLTFYDKSIESLSPILRKLSGINASSQTTEYAVDSFVYDLLNFHNKGIEFSGISIPSRAVNFKKVFSRKQLINLNAAKIILNQSLDTVTPFENATDVKIELLNPSKNKKAKPENRHPKTPIKHPPFDETNCLPTKQTPLSKNSDDVDYPGAIWVAAANFSSRNNSEITHIVLHTMQGSYAGSINYFQDSSTQASAHYMLRSSDGQITQMVREIDKAWHARSANPYTIGFEHEGYVDDRSWYTEEMLTESAKLAQSICQSYQIDCNKTYDGISHDTVVLLSQEYTIKGHQHFPDQTHTDPGINWDWPYYHSLVNGLTAPNRFPEALFDVVCNLLTCELDANASNDIDGSIVTYTWDFGDNTNSTGVKVSHQYSAAGSYTISLTVTDNIGAENKRDVLISAKQASPKPTPTKNSGGGAVWFVLPVLFFRSLISVIKKGTL